MAENIRFIADLDARKFNRDVNTARKNARGIGSAIGAATKALTVATVAVGAFAGATAIGIKRAVDASSDLTESVNATRVVFGKYNDEFRRFGDEQQSVIKVTRAEFNQFGAQIGGILQNYGSGVQQSVKQTQGLISIAADLASVYNVDVQEALVAVRAGLVGETEGLRRFGIDISVNALQAAGLVTQASSQAEKAQARINLLTRQAAKVQGDAAATQMEYAAQSRLTGINITEIAATIGRKFEPVLLSGTIALNEMLVDLRAAFGDGGELSGGLQRIADFARVVVRNAVPAVRSTISFVVRLFDTIVDRFQVVIPAIAPLARDVSQFIISIYNTLYNTINPIFGTIKDNIQAVFNFLRDIGIGGGGVDLTSIAEKFDEIMTTIRQGFAELPEEIQGILKVIASSIIVAFLPLPPLLKVVLAPLISALLGAVGDLGKILSDGFNTLRERLAEEFPGLTQKLKNFGNTLRGVWAGVLAVLDFLLKRYSGNIASFVNSVITGVGMAIGFLIKIGSEIARLFGPQVQPTVALLISSIGSLIDAVSDAISNIGEFDVNLAGLAGSLIGVGGLALAIGKVITGLRDLFTSLVQIGNYLRPGGFLAVLNGLGSQLLTVVSAFLRLRSGVREVFGAIGRLGTGFATFLRTIGRFFTGGGTFARVLRAFGGLLSRFGNLQSLLRVIPARLASLGGALGKLAGRFGKFGGPIGIVVSLIAGFFTNLDNVVLSLEDLQDWWRRNGPKLFSDIGAIVRIVIALFTEFAKFVITQVVIPAFRRLAIIWGTVVLPVVEAFAGWFTDNEEVIISVIRGITRVLNGLFRFVNPLLDLIVFLGGTAIGGALRNVVELTLGIVGALLRIADTLLHIDQRWRELWNGIARFTESIINNIISAFESVINAIPNQLNSLANSLSSITSSIPGLSSFRVPNVPSVHVPRVSIPRVQGYTPPTTSTATVRSPSSVYDPLGGSAPEINVYGDNYGFDDIVDLFTKSFNAAKAQGAID